MCCPGPSKPPSVRGQPLEFDLPFAALELLHISIHESRGGQNFGGEEAVPDEELGLHRLILVMENSEGVVGREKVKVGSGRGRERKQKRWQRAARGPAHKITPHKY